MIETPLKGLDTAILVHVNFYAHEQREEVEEFQLLAKSAGIEMAELFIVNRSAPVAGYLIGEGKLEELKAAVANHHVSLVLFNHALTPAQQRNLERFLEARVIDRTELILDIFAQRARSFEGKLQVELAQLQHLSTRLIRGWTHLERQKGGIGLRGPGETQLETDRRLIRGRIKTIKERLEKVRSQREQGRRSRQRSEIPTVSLVGYTNSGKSSLFNRITGAEVYAANQLFATLDPTLRRVEIPHFGPVILADTVGFIRHLPHDLVDAFRSTLEETREADLLLHVIDSQDPNRHTHCEQVDIVLKEIGAENVPQIRVYNKIDLQEGALPEIRLNEQGIAEKVRVSALTGAGISLLFQAIAERLTPAMVRKTITLPVQKAEIRAKLYQNNYVMKETIDEEGNYILSLYLPKKIFDAFEFHS